MDDLLDLDLSAPAAPSSSSSAARGPQAAYGAGKSSFDYLSQMRTNTPSPLPSRSASPYSPSSTSTASANGRLAPAAGARPAPPAKGSSGAGDDAFSSLFGASPSSAQGNGGGLSMAQRLAQESAAKIGGAGANGGTWTTLGPSSTGGSGSRSPSPALAPSRGASTNSTTAPKPAKVNPDPWDFDLLASAPPVLSSTKPKPSTANKDPFDLGFDTPPSSSCSPAPAASRSNGNAPRNVLDDDDPFDTSSSLLGNSSAPAQHSTTAPSDDFDLLGAFSQPAPPSRSPVPAPSQPSRTRTPSSAPSRASTASPPPHVLGSLIEMGFSIPQSKAALVATASPEGGWNVEAALEALVEEQQVGAAQERRREEEQWGSRLAEEEAEERPRPRQQRREREREEPVLEERPATGRRAREAAAKAKADAATAAQTKVQEQANELLAQASKIGFSMFKSANAYWEKGRETVKKALDEAQEGGDAAAGDGASNGRLGGREAPAGSAKGRPKWWTEDMVDDEEGTSAPVASASSSRRRPSPSEEAPTKPPPTLFQDSDHESDGGVVDDVLPQRPSAAPSAPQRQPHRPPPPSQSAPTRPTPPTAAPPSAEYRSPWRRAKSTATPSAPSPPPAAPPRRTPTPPPARPPRISVPHSPTALATSLEHKTTGNSHFKLGQFGDADAAYTKAIDALPNGSLALVPLLNNRAAARLRNGDERKAGEDAGEVIRILLRLEKGVPFTEPSAADLAALDAEVLPAEASDLSLREQLGKALGKRAKANETNEKWKAALVDWETLSKGGEVLVKSGGGRKVASEGIARCKKMLGGEGGSAPPISTMGNVSAVAARRAQQAATSSTPPRPRPAASTSAPAVQGSGDAVRALQAASAAALAEEDLRLSLKDSVDARITAWKGGKEANLRALIASLENVLWPELEWKKVGMHELISVGLLKVRYVRAIGKVHPDKLNVNNTTVEQRMIAGGVFAGLNDAWNAQKA